MNRDMKGFVKKVFFFMILMTLSFSCKKAKTANKNETVTVNIPSYPLTNEKDLDILINQIGDAKIVLLGEASHGTAEYYTWRAALSKRLIAEKGFDFIAVEGEWADSYRVNRFIKGPKRDSAAAVELLKQYNRWPTWMWGNLEVASLVTWLNSYNQNPVTGSKAGFFGLDVYCLWESMAELKPYIQNNPDLVKKADKVEECFKPFGSDPQQYAEAVAYQDASCRQETQALWESILQTTGGNPSRNEDLFVMEQNSLVALNAENYYRSMVSSDNGSWNVRDRHMTRTLQRLLDLHGPDSKAIVWEHNTHVGDARYTDMKAEGMVNVGQLVRESYGEEKVFIVGFGSYSGSVIAANAWGSAMKEMEVPEASKGSWEQILHSLSPTNKIVLSKDIKDNALLSKSVGHRAIGVVYDPKRERGNYVPTVIPKRYDAFVFIDKTTALHPLNITVTANEPPDLYPSGD